MPLTRRDPSRREMVLSSLVTAAGLALGARLAAAALRARPRDEPHEGDDTNIKPAEKKLCLLILGGTGFTGPHLVRLALRRGHSVTVFNRGRTEKRIGELPKEVERLLGDRDPDKGDGLKALQGDQKWDAVVDTSGQIPRHVRAGCELLKDRVKTYLYVSSISAFKSPAPVDAREDAPLAELADPNTEEVGAGYENYGGLKAACERTAQSIMPGRVANVRPTFISGPGDPTDRFTYWPVRIALQGGKVLCPGDGADPIQFIDSRDLAAFYLHLCETGQTGVFNAAGPNPPITVKGLVDLCVKQAKVPVEPVWVPMKFLEEHQVGEAGEFTIWIPRDSKEAGMARINIDRAMKAGLKFRPVEATVRDTLAWWPKEVERRARVGKEMAEQAEKDGKPAPQLPSAEKLRAGFPDPAKEQEVLAAWAAKGKAG